MSNLLIKPYEISVWSDCIENGKPRERKEAIIGSNTMEGPFRATNISLKRNVNGTKTLTFSLYINCYDEETHVLRPNPFLPYMSNERKVKLFYEGEWSDFIIKNIQENSTNKMITYTAKDLFINELGKTGFNLVFDTELMNNQGTITELAEKILEGTDWTVDKENSTLLRQTEEDPLYEWTTSGSYSAVNMLSGQVVTIPSGTKVYLFYTTLAEKSNYVQLLYYKNIEDFKIEDGVVVKSLPHQYYVTVDWNSNYSFADTKQITDYRADRLVRKQKSTYDSTLGRQVYYYEKNGTTYYGFVDAEYISPTVIENYIVNPNNFSSTDGWRGSADTVIKLELIPAVTNNNFIDGTKVNAKPYIKIENSDGMIYNAGFISNRSKIYEIAKGDKFVFRYKIGTSNGNSVTPMKVSAVAGSYEYQDSSYSIKETIFNFNNSTLDEEGYYCCVAEANEAWSYQRLQNASLGFFLNQRGTFYLEDVQFFKYHVIEKVEDVLTSGENTRSAYSLTRAAETKGSFYVKNGETYFKIEETGEDATYWHYIGGKWYLFSLGPEYGKPTGAMYRGWVYDWSNWYFLDRTSGQLVTGWVQDSGQTYYCSTEGSTPARGGSLGKMVNGQQNIAGQDYVFADSGELLSGTKPTVLGMAVPGEYFPPSTESTYFYYNPNSNYSNRDDIIFEDTSVGVPSESYVPVYSNDYEKVRSITASESNRFNLIQELCEVFECWAKFNILHNENGEIVYSQAVQPNGSNAGGSPNNTVYYKAAKTIQFLEYVGQDNYRGFRYGINLKSIQRTLDSEAHVSKLIIKENSNEFAKDGFCSAARASLNPYKENFILNFDYYINHNLLDESQLNKDLYDESAGIGYLSKLQSINRNRDTIIEQRSKLETERMQLQAEVDACSIGEEEALEEFNEKNSELIDYCGITYQALISNPNNARWDDERVQEICTAITIADNLAKSFEERKKFAEDQLGSTELNNGQPVGVLNQLQSIEQQLSSNAQKKEELDAIFYAKYYRFLQEGSWVSEDYYDDDLYYLDAKGVLHTSAFPKVTYNISVMEISQVEGYENYTYSVGDKTYMEDTEFFGWVYVDGIQTPFKEEIVLSETVDYLDSPEKNTIRVQNYKTQFDDLFQRVAASVQNLQLHTGAYERAASAFETNGVINFDLLQNTIIAGDIFFQTAGNKTIIWDNYGIKTSQPSDSNKQIRIANGALLVTTDGGKTWKTMLTPSGINADYINAGKIDASVINIVDGNAPSFSWDKNGINAYSPLVSGQGYDLSNFVRFDKYGVYAIDGPKVDAEKTYGKAFDPSNYVGYSSPEDLIQDKATFSLTREGFTLKTKFPNIDEEENKGKFSITSKEDLQLFNEVIKLGRLSDDLKTYGLRLSDYNGNPVLTASSSIDGGNLVLTGRIGIKEELSDYDNNFINNRVELGLLKKYDNGYNKIFSAKPNTLTSSENNEKLENGETLAIFDDGTLLANKVNLTGTINATGGKIGNLTIQEMVTKIESIDGSNFKTISIENSNGLVFTDEVSELNFEVIIEGFEEEPNYRWSYSSDLDSWTEFSQEKNLNLTFNQISDKLNLNNSIFLEVAAIQDNLIIATDIVELVYNLKVQNSFGVEQIERIRTNKSLGTELSDIFNPEIIYCINENLRSIEFKTIENNKILTINLEDLSVIPSNFISSNLDLLQINLQAILDASYLEVESNSIAYRLIETIKNYDNLNLIANYETVKGFCSIRRKIFTGWAEMSLGQDEISMTIEDTKLTFDQTGLTIDNGKFKIVNANGEAVLYGDQSGNLTFEGNVYANNGIFNGTVNATSGSFTGTINAAAGSIGGVVINENDLSLGRIILHAPVDEVTETGKPLDEHATYGYIAAYADDANTELGFVIRDDGQIIANNLAIGGDSYIADSLRVGDVLIKNPEDNGIFLDAGAFTATAAGDLTLGNLKLNGTSSTISGNNWSIDPTTAIFNNIVATGTFKTSVFEAQSVSLTGGKTIFKSGAIIEDYVYTGNQNNILKIKEGILSNADAGNAGFNVDDYLLITRENGIDSILAKVVSINGDSLEIEIINDYGISNVTFNLALNLGKFTDKDNVKIGNDWVIGVNSTNSRGKLGLRNNSLTVSELSIEDNDLKVENKIVLGDLTNIFSADKTSGLYATSVYLTGTLTTSYKDGNEILYAGVNTLNGVNFNKDIAFEKDNSPIVFWAGSDGKADESIQNSKFQVTSNGTLYAQQGYFKGSIITDATIEASEIKTPTITGTGTGEAALTIKNADNAIDFIGGSNQSIFKVATDGLELNTDAYFGNQVKIESNKNSYIFPHLYIVNHNHTDTGIKNTASILGPQIFGFSSMFEDNFYTPGYNAANIEAYMGFRTDVERKDKSIYLNVGNHEILQIQKNENETKVAAMSDEFYIDDELNFGGVMRMVKRIDGYDLYFEDKEVSN